MTAMTKHTQHLLASAAPGGGLASDAVRPALAVRFAPQLLVTAALLSAGAAVIHAAVAGPHFEEYAPFGLLFFANALGQTIGAVLLLAAPSVRLLAVGVAGNMGILAAWAISRTTGLPVGPEPGTPEPIGALDITAAAFELGLVVAAITLIAARDPLAMPGRQDKHFAAIGAAVLVAVTGAAFAKEQAGAGHHGAATEHHADPEPDQTRAASDGADLEGRLPSPIAGTATAPLKAKPGKPSTPRAPKAHPDQGHTHATPHDR